MNGFSTWEEQRREKLGLNSCARCGKPSEVCGLCWEHYQELVKEINKKDKGEGK